MINAVLQFDARNASAQSQAFIFGGALGSAWATLARRHPDDPRRPLIDYDMVLLLLPLMLAGVVGGTLLNRVFPNWLITFLLLIVLVWQALASGLKAWAMRQREKAAAAAAVAAQQQGMEQSRSIAEVSGSGSGAGHGGWRGMMSTSAQRLARLSFPEVYSSGWDAIEPAEWQARQRAQSATEAELAAQAGRQRAGGAAQAAPRRGVSVPAGGPAADLAASAAGPAGAKGQREEQQQEEEPVLLVEVPISSNSGKGAPVPPSATAAPPPARPSLWQEMGADLVRLPRFDGGALRRLAAIGALWAEFLGCQVAQGVVSQRKGTRCYTAYYVIMALEFAVLIGVAVGYTAVVRRRQQAAAQSRRAAASGEEGAVEKEGGLGRSASGRSDRSGRDSCDSASWSLKKVVVVQCIAISGGTLATMLGLGGGLVVGLLLLALEVTPLVASATSSFMVLLTVGSATLTYAISDQLNLDYSLIFGASCLVGGLLGVTAVNAVVRRSSAGSLVVALMAVVVAAGAVLCAAYSVPQAVDQLAAGTNIGMGSFC